MSDSPFIQAPTDPREKPILDDLVSIRDKLLLLKQDRSTYVKSQDVMPLYDEVIEQVHRLNNIRVEVGLEQNRGSYYASRTKRYSINRGQWTLCSTIAFN